MVMIGADTQQLRLLGSQMKQAAQNLGDMEKRISAALRCELWVGHDADSFRDFWNRTLRPSLNTTAADLLATGIELEKQAAEQERASESPIESGPEIDLPDPLATRNKFLFWEVGKPEYSTSRDFDQPLYSGNSPKPGDVQQGGLGDCYFAAAIAAMAATETGRQVILSAIDDKNDGTYNVGFRNGQTVTVDDDFYTPDGDDHAAAYMRISDTKWAAVLEEAYVRHHGTSATFNAIEGGHASVVFDAFGMAGTWREMRALRSDEELLGILRQGVPATMQASLDNPDGITGRSSSDFHEFSVIAVRDTPEGPRIEMRNPWGSNAGLRFPPDVSTNDDGTFLLTAQRARRMFSRINWAGKS